MIHSNGGTITFEIDDNGGVCLSFDDIGPGIPNIELAMTLDSQLLHQKPVNLDLELNGT
ncbi:MAG: hypothetical protein ACLSBH_14645 [Coprobacillus cateniformis]